MTKRERVICALRRQETDVVPYQIGFTQQARERTAAYLQDPAFLEKVGNHIISAYYSGSPRQVRPGFFQDDFGVLWNRTGADRDIGVIDAILLPEPDLSRYRFPKVPEAAIRSHCEAVLSGRGDRFTLAGLGFSLFERAWTLTGMENLLVYMLTDPDFVDGLMAAITEFNLQVIRIFLDYDFDCVHFGDDWGQQKGLIMGPALWRRFIKPSLARMYGLVKGDGRFVSQHSCGDIQEVFPDVIELGLDIYQTFQPEIYDIRAMKEQYGDRLAFWGGISTQRLLPFETPARIRQVARETLSILGRGGGYIAAPTHDLPGDIPPENIVALMEVFENQAPGASGE